MVLDATSPLLDAVKALWRKNASALGFFPDGAFRDRALQAQILAAVDEGEQLLGYLLYRVSSRQVATIVHLCISLGARQRGVARHLVSHLKGVSSGLRGVGLTCRRDFPASSLWPRLGFIAHSERAGRSASGSRLIYWWFGFDHADLFESTHQPDDDTTIVGIDVNVLLDLYRENHDESRGLKADWLSSLITIAVTPETRAELLRCEARSEREAVVAYAKQFDQLFGSHTRAEGLILELETLLQPGDERDRSDIRQLAWATAGDADVFLTRDEFLLKNRRKLQEVTGLRINRPSELIAEIDLDQRPPEYQRARLAGTLISFQREAAVPEAALATAFQNQLSYERKAAFLVPIRELMATPDTGAIRVIRDATENPIGLAAYAYSRDGITRVRRLRVSAGALSLSLARYLTNWIVRTSVERSDGLCLVEDQNTSQVVQAALNDQGFMPHHGLWLKASFRGSYTSNEAIQKILSLHTASLSLAEQEHLALLSSSLKSRSASTSINDLLALEQAIWPGTIKDLALPTFIVPVRPVWAQHLFDEQLANEQLFGARVDLALNDEAIYYRAVRNSGGLRAPGRILWYVSRDSRMLPVGQIRAMSRVNEVTVGPASEIFRQFRRLGIYEWRHVRETAQGDPQNRVMAIRFGKTQPLARPVSYPVLQDCLRKHDIHTQIQSPVEIPVELWHKLVYEAI